MEEKVVIRLKNVSKTFKINEGRSYTLKAWLKNLFKPSQTKLLKALDNINLEINQGERIGIVGRNGSGKSTLIKIMSGAYLPDKGGIVEKDGKSMLMSLRVGMSPELTARQNVYVSGSALGLRIADIDKMFDDIIAFAELEDFVDTRTRFFSNGMIQRLSFAIAINAGTPIMFLDEVFAVGDKKFKEKAIEVMEKNWLEGRTTIMVSHNLSNLTKYCNKVLYLKKGKMVYYGDPKTAIRRYNRDNN